MEHVSNKSINITTSEDAQPPPVPPRPQKLQTNTTSPPVSQTNSFEKVENQQHAEQKVCAKKAQLAEQEETDEDDDSNLIFGPAETITGIIDTRPLDQRTNYISFAQLSNNVTTNFNLITISDTINKEQPSKAEDKSPASNTYLLKSNQLNNNQNNSFSNNTVNGTNNHQRHMSVPVASNATPLKTLPTSSSTFQASISQKMPNDISSSSSSSSAALPTSKVNNVVTTSALCNASTKLSNLQLYENVKLKSASNLMNLNNINNNHNSSNSNSNNNNNNINNSSSSASNGGSNGNVPYENINLEYINRLMKEGYSKENVMAALCISRNNFEMACDILHEFVSTNHQTQTSKIFEK
jgi:hypothetical protein